MRVHGYSQVAKVAQPVKPVEANSGNLESKPLRKDQYSAQQEQADRLLRMLEPKGRIIDIRV